MLFHIYFDNGFLKAFMISTLEKFNNVEKPVNEMTFVWIVPKYRRNGMFAKMYKDLCELKKAPIYVDQPNKACKKALKNINYSEIDVIQYYGLMQKENKNLDGKQDV